MEAGSPPLPTAATGCTATAFNMAADPATAAGGAVGVLTSPSGTTSTGDKRSVLARRSGEAVVRFGEAPARRGRGHDGCAAMPAGGGTARADDVSERTAA